MLTKPIALIGLAAIMLAAGAGSYVAVRQNAAPIQQGDATDASIAPPAAISETAGQAVESTEATVEGTGLDAADNAEPAAPSTPPAPTPPARESVEAPVSSPTPSAPPPTREVRTSEPTARIEPPSSTDATPEASPAGSQTNDREAPAVPDVSAVSEPTPAPVQEAPQRAPVERAAADLPAVEGWSRVEADPQETNAAVPLEAEPLLGDRPQIAAPPEPMLVEYEIAADSVIGLQVETGVSTRTADVEDSVEARVTRDVVVADEVAVPAGTRVLGSVVLVEQAGKLRDASRLGIRFHTLVMDEGTRVPVVTETIYREGDPKGRDSVGKIGGAAVGGAILGAIFGGARGAAIGGSIGAAGGTAAAVSTEGQPAGLPPGTRLNVRLSRPAIVTVAP